MGNYLSYLNILRTCITTSTQEDVEGILMAGLKLDGVGKVRWDETRWDNIWEQSITT